MPDSTENTINNELRLLEYNTIRYTTYNSLCNQTLLLISPSKSRYVSK